MLQARELVVRVRAWRHAVQTGLLSGSPSLCRSLLTSRRGGRGDHDTERAAGEAICNRWRRTQAGCSERISKLRTTDVGLLATRTSSLPHCVCACFHDARACVSLLTVTILYFWVHMCDYAPCNHIFVQDASSCTWSRVFVCTCIPLPLYKSKFETKLFYPNNTRP